MKLSVIIVNYNTSQLLKKCLTRLFQALTFSRLESQSEVIVVDNASKDESCQMMEKNFPQVKLIKNIKNLGFAKANNQGIKKAKGEFILLLNSDTEVEKNIFFHLIPKLEKNPQIGIIGPRLLNKDGTLQQSLGYFPSLLKVLLWMSFIDDLPILSLILKPYHLKDTIFYKKEREIDWVSAACLLVRREAIKKGGLLDEKIFMYGEEVEWCYRIKKAGFKVFYVPYTAVLHLKGASGKEKAAGILEEFSSLKYIYRKHKGKFEFLFLKLFLMFGALCRFFLFGIITRDSLRAQLYAQAFQVARR